MRKIYLLLLTLLVSFGVNVMADSYQLEIDGNAKYDFELQADGTYLLNMSDVSILTPENGLKLIVTTTTRTTRYGCNKDWNNGGEEIKLIPGEEYQTAYDISNNSPIHLAEAVSNPKVELTKKSYDYYLLITSGGEQPGEKSPSGLSFGESNYNAVLGTAFTSPSLTNPHNLPVTWSSSEEGVATVSSVGTVDLQGEGQTVITATFAGNDKYEKGSASYTLTVSPAEETPKLPSDLSFSVSEIEAVMGESFTRPTLNNIHDLPIEWKSSNTGVATVNSATGAVTLVGEGETVITATFAGNDKYNSGEAAYKLIVTLPDTSTSKTVDLTQLGVHDNISSPYEITDGSLKIVFKSANNNGYSSSNSGFVINKNGNGTITLSAAHKKITKFLIVVQEGLTLKVNGTELKDTEEAADYYYRWERPLTYSSNDVEIDYSTYFFYESNRTIVKIEVEYENVSEENPNREPAELSFDLELFETELGSTPASPVLNNPHNLAIEWESSNPEVATVDENGVLTVISEGETLIKATSAATEQYNSGEAYYLLKVWNSEVTDSTYSLILFNPNDKSEKPYMFKYGRGRFFVELDFDLNKGDYIYIKNSADSNFWYGKNNADDKLWAGTPYRLGNKNNKTYVGTGSCVELAEEISNPTLSFTIDDGLTLIATPGEVDLVSRNYYLIGDFNNWGEGIDYEAATPFTVAEDGTMSLDYEGSILKGQKFRVVKGRYPGMSITGSESVTSGKFHSVKIDALGNSEDNLVAGENLVNPKFVVNHLGGYMLVNPEHSYYVAGDYCLTGTELTPANINWSKVKKLDKVEGVESEDSLYKVDLSATLYEQGYGFMIVEMNPEISNWPVNYIIGKSDMIHANEFYPVARQSSLPGNLIPVNATYANPTILFNASKDIVMINPTDAYYLVGYHCNWDGEDVDWLNVQDFSQREDGTYYLSMAGQLEAGNDKGFRIVKHEVSNPFTFSEYWSYAGEIVDNTIHSVEKNSSIGNMYVSELKEAPRFVFAPEDSGYGILKMNPKSGGDDVNYGTYNYFRIVGATTGSNGNPAKTKAMTRTEGGWYVLKDVEFANQSFNLIRCNSIGTQFKVNGDEKYGLILSEAPSQTVKENTEYGCGYAYNTPKGGNFKLSKTGKFDVYFHPEKMIVKLVGAPWQFFGDIGSDGRWESRDMSPQKDGTWSITFDNCQGGEFYFRTLDNNGKYKYIKTHYDSQTPLELTANGTYTNLANGSIGKSIISKLQGSHTFNLDPTNCILKVTGEEGPVPVKIVATFLRNGDEYPNMSGYLYMPGRHPGKNGVDGVHGMYIKVIYSDGNVKYLVSAEGAEDKVGVGEHQALKLVDEQASVELDITSADIDETIKYNFAIDWRNINNASLYVTKVDDPDNFYEKEEDWLAQYPNLRIYGNINSETEMVLYPVNFVPFEEDDEWLVLENVTFKGTDFRIQRVDESGKVMAPGNNSDFGNYYGAFNDYYISSDDEHICFNMAENPGGHDFVLSQPGTYTIYYHVVEGRISVQGNHLRPDYATVYFVDKTPKQGNIKAFAFTRPDDPNKDHNLVKDSNGAMPGEDVQRLDNADPLYTLIGDADADIYKFNVNSSRWSYVVFSGVDADNNVVKSSNDLYVVNGGVYYFDSEFFPTNYYNPEETGDPELMTYPNVLTEHANNNIYIDVPAFAAKAEAGKKISFDIRWNKNGEDFTATGVRGTTTGVLETYQLENDVKKLIRLSMPDKEIPDGVTVRMRVWIGTEPDGVTDCKAISHSHNAENDHWNCSDENRPLIFNEVVYKNGAVYSRSEEQKDIMDIIRPSVVYIQAADNMMDQYNTTGKNGRYIRYITDGGEASTVLVTRNIYNIGNQSLDNLNEETRIGYYEGVYSFGNVLAGSDFVFKIQYGPSDASGTQYYLLPASNETEILRPGTLYPVVSCPVPDIKAAQPTTYFHLEPQEAMSHIEKYNLIFDLKNMVVYAEGVSKVADFGIGKEYAAEEQGDYFKFAAVANDEHAGNGLGWTFEEGGELQMQNPTTLYISHSKEFGFVGGYQNDVHYASVVAEIKPTADYSHYFEGNVEEAAYPVILPYTDENVMEHHAVMDKDAVNVSKLQVKAYTAGDYNVILSTPNIKNADGKLEIKASKKTLLAKVYPTVQSVGLAINGKLVMPLLENGQFNVDSNELAVLIQSDSDEEKEEPIYTTTAENGNPMYWPTDKGVCIESYMANNANVEVYWKFVNDNASAIKFAPRRRSVVAVAESEVVNPQPEDGMQLYTRTNSLNDANIAAATPEGQDYAVAQFQVKQNGVLGEPQNVKVFTKLNDNLPTSVKEIESAEVESDVEAIYYDVNGYRVNGDNLLPGIYIVVKGDKSEKIYVK